MSKPLFLQNLDVSYQQDKAAAFNQQNYQYLTVLFYIISLKQFGRLCTFLKADTHKPRLLVTSLKIPNIRRYKFRRLQKRVL